MFTITLPNGDTKNIRISLFKALDGWDIQNKFIDFAATTDRTIRREFTLEVLSYAHIVYGDQEIPLITDALIDNHLQTWENIQVLFNEILMRNGIDPETHAEKANYWDAAGATIAVTFIAECTKLMGPAMGTFVKSMDGK